MTNYFWHIFIALDRLLNAIANGDGRLTLSSRFWRGDCVGSRKAHIARIVTDFIALHVFGQANHCQSSDAFDTALVAMSIGMALRSL